MLVELTTWENLMGASLEQYLDMDPENQLKLSEERREELADLASDIYLEQANEILEYFDAYVLRNGQVYANSKESAWKFRERTPQQHADLLEELRMIDLGTVFELYFQTREGRWF